MAFTRGVRISDFQMLLAAGVSSISIALGSLTMYGGVAQAQSVSTKESNIQEIVQQSERTTSEEVTLESLLSGLDRPGLSTEQQGGISSEPSEQLPENFIPDDFKPDDFEISFFCGSDGDFPKTVMNNFIAEFTLIEWTKEYYPETNETPLERCTSVASTFQKYHQEGLLNSITTEEVDGLPAICISGVSRNSCGRVVLLLEEGENADRVVNAFRESITLLLLESQSILQEPSSNSDVPEYIQAVDDNLQVVNDSEDFTAIDLETFESIQRRSGGSIMHRSYGRVRSGGGRR